MRTTYRLTLLFLSAVTSVHWSVLFSGVYGEKSSRKQTVLDPTGTKSRTDKVTDLLLYRVEL